MGVTDAVYIWAGVQFAFMQLGMIIATVVRRLELRIEKVPEPDYSVRFLSFSWYVEHEPGSPVYQIMITLPKHPRSISYRPRKN